jgi:hypothetical protein
MRRFRVEFVCFPLVAAVYAAHLFSSGYDTFYYDAAGYWARGQSFESNGHFSLLAYLNDGRGYSLPLVNHVLQVIAADMGIGAVTIVKIFGALFAATLGVIVIPRLARALFPAASIGFERVLALNVLFFLYWRDYFDFPMSDFPALLLAAVGVIGLLRASAWGYVVAGLGLGLAVNMRSAYLTAAIAVVAVAALVPYRPWAWRKRGAAVALVLAGAFVVSLPQMLINHHQPGGSWSPLVPGGKVTTMKGLSDGMIAQKYETYVGPPTGYPQPEVFFFDPATTHVLEKEHISTTIVSGQYSAFSSYGQYARVVFHHPVEMAAAYVRRIFNGLDVRYPTPYVRNLRDTSLLLSLLQYTLMFGAIASVSIPSARRALGRVRWAGVVVLLSACLTVVPTQAESRYFLPLQLLIYMLVCFAPGARASLFGGSSGRRVSIAVCYAAFVLACLTLSSATLHQIQHPEPVLGLVGEGKSGSA